MPAPTMRLSPRVAMRIVTTTVEYVETDVSDGPPTCCVVVGSDGASAYVECDRCRRERLEEQDSVDSHLALARNS